MSFHPPTPSLPVGQPPQRGLPHRQDDHTHGGRIRRCLGQAVVEVREVKLTSIDTYRRDRCERSLPVAHVLSGTRVPVRLCPTWLSAVRLVYADCTGGAVGAALGEVSGLGVCWWFDADAVVFDFFTPGCSGVETIALSQCALQRGVTYKAFAYVEGLNSSYTDGQASQPVLVLVPVVSMRFKTEPFLAESVLTSRVAFKFTTEATDQGAAAVVAGNVWAMVVPELQAPQVTRWSLKSMMGSLAMGGPGCRIDGESMVGGTAVVSLTEVSAVLEDCQLRHGSTYELVVYVEDMDNRSDGTMVFTKIYTPPGVSNSFKYLPMIDGNVTGEEVTVQFAGANQMGKAWAVVVPASAVSSATASSVMSGTGALGGPDCMIAAMDVDDNVVDLENCSMAFSSDYAVLVYLADMGMHDDGEDYGNETHSK
ncbi:unnamed protein product [Symbiodinium microadriaticum]|nr:unnamed protein product [Symbiodinium microadriaticum]